MAAARGKTELDAGGDLSPTYTRELDRRPGPGGHWSWWYTKSIHEIDEAALSDWS